MKKILSIVSASQIAQLLNNNPILLSIPAFIPLNQALQQVKQTQSKKCNCNPGNNVNHLLQLRPMMESILSNMSSDDYLKMKSLLNIDELCYYKKDATNKLVKTCL